MSLSVDGKPLFRLIRGRRGPPRCVPPLRVGKPLRRRRSGRELTKGHCVSSARHGMRKRCCGAVGKSSALQSKRREAGTPTSQAPALGTWLSSREIRPPLWPASSACPGGTQVDQEALAADRNTLGLCGWWQETGRWWPAHPGRE